MAANLDVLDSTLKTKVAELLARCRKRGIEMRPNNGLRDPVEQGRLWRQSRSIEEITGKIHELRAKGAPFLAECIERAGPRHGGHVTNAVPGMSWHQWGEALDCFWLVDGHAEWSTRRQVDGLNGYVVYADEAIKLELTAGGHWPRFKDWPHVQLRKENTPLSGMQIDEVNRIMRERFG